MNTSNQKFIVKDWMGNVLDFKGKFQHYGAHQLGGVETMSFTDEDDAWDWIYSHIQDDSAWQDIYVDVA